MRRVAERRIEVRDGQAQADGYLSFMANPEAFYIDRIDQEWFDTRFPEARATSVIGPAEAESVLLRSSEEANTLAIVSEQHRDTTHSITSRDGIGVVEHAGGTTFFAGYETVTFTGSATGNTLVLGPLAPAGVSNATVHVDLVGGANRLDARALDVRLVAVGGDGADVLLGGAGDDAFHPDCGSWPL